MTKLYNVPTHIAFIIDGNGRWAKKRHLIRNIGHKYGVEAVKKTINACLDFKIKVASFFVFSTENWKRPQDEIDGIFKLLKDYLKSDLHLFNEKGIKLVVSGSKDKLPQDIILELDRAVESTQNNTNIIVNLCLNYGGRFDIINAVNNIIKDKLEAVNEQTFSKYLLTYPLSDPDLVIRTSGELRYSNFLLYQGAYSELYFTKTFWPDFNKRRLYKALKNYQKRNRRFGGLKK